MTIPAFRFAPSPNGELHLGHAYSALLNAHMAREIDGRFLVRIEDIDVARCTRDLTVKALADLAWLGLSWEEPVRFQSEHMADYHVQQARLQAMGLLYPCFCSRADVQRAADAARRDPEGQPVYPGTCRKLARAEAARRIVAGEPHALRLDMRAASGDAAARAWGDVTLVRKDIGTSYHLAVVTDDHLQGISHVVRGKDLEAATSIHMTLQRLLDFATPHYFHHRLIGDETGRKLSKSEGAKSLRALRAQGVTAAEVRAALGF